MKRVTLGESCATVLLIVHCCVCVVGVVYMVSAWLIESIGG